MMQYGTGMSEDNVPQCACRVFKFAFEPAEIVQHRAAAVKCVSCACLIILLPFRSCCRAALKEQEHMSQRLRDLIAQGAQLDQQQPQPVAKATVDQRDMQILAQCKKRLLYLEVS